MSDSLKQKREIAQSEAQDLTGKFISSLVGLGPAYELITKLIVPLHEKKKREFINDLAIRLKKLEDEGQIDFEKLAESEEFNTLITKAILLAQQTHQKKKLHALRNIILHAAKQSYCDELNFTVTDFFLSILDRITPLHIHLLKFFQSPNSYTVKNKNEFLTTNEFNSSRLKIFYIIYPHLKEKGVFIKVYWNELFDFGLVRVNTLNESVSLSVSLKASTTQLGNQFLDMIESAE